MIKNRILEFRTQGLGVHILGTHAGQSRSDLRGNTHQLSKFGQALLKIGVIKRDCFSDQEFLAENCFEN